MKHFNVYKRYVRGQTNLLSIKMCVCVCVCILPVPMYRTGLWILHFLLFIGETKSMEFIDLF